MMESTKVKVDQINERERREMAEAARQTIITLQEMSQSKNEQLQRKDDIIDELKRKIIAQKH